MNRDWFILYRQLCFWKWAIVGTDKLNKRILNLFKSLQAAACTFSAKRSRSLGSSNWATIAFINIVFISKFFCTIVEIIENSSILVYYFAISIFCNIIVVFYKLERFFLIKCNYKLLAFEEVFF